MSVIDFFKYGVDISGIQEFQASRYPYFVRPNLREKSPTIQDADYLLTAISKNSPQGRMQLVPGKAHQTIVDKFFLVTSRSKAPKEAAIKMWSDLRSSCQKMSVGAGSAAASLTLLALWGAPLYIEVALFVGIVTACYFAGRSLQRYLIAEKELAGWRSPGEDFAIRRKASLELTLDKISKQKCHYHLEQPGGTLLGVEILFIFKQNLKRFAESLLSRQCGKPEEQHQWVVDFLNSNPLMIDFFQDNPHLLTEKGWEDVGKFQIQMAALINLLKNLREFYVPQFSRYAMHAKMMEEYLNRALFVSAVDVCKTLNLNPQTTQLYQRRILQALKEEYFLKVSTRLEQLKVKTTYFCSLVYPQVRVLLEQASRGLVEEKAYTLDPASFANPQALIPNFQQELKTISANYPQNVIDKAKSFSLDATYQKFVAEVFKS